MNSARLTSNTTVWPRQQDYTQAYNKY